MGIDQGARGTITLPRIVDEALALVDDEGLERLSMRRLGARLGVEAMALYHHVPSKSALLDLLLERIVLSTGAEAFEPRMDWRGWIGSFASNYREALLMHPALLPLVATRPIRSAAALELLQTGGRTLVSAGFKPTQAIQMLNVVGMFVIGHALAEGGEPVVSEVDDPRSSNIAAEVLGDPLSPARRHHDIFDVGMAALLNGFECLRL